MNFQQLTSLAASLCLLQSRLDAVLDEVRQSIDDALAPDAGLVVVKADARPLTLCVDGSDNVERFILRAMWLMHGQPMRDGDWLLSDATWPATSPHAYDISHLTIADGRGEGEVVACAMSWMTDPWIGNHLYAGPDPYILHIGLWDARICGGEAFAYNHAYPHDQRHWWGYSDEFSTLDCATVPHAMTWRAA